jgi:mono/diheme cytochrome c family protein
MKPNQPSLPSRAGAAAALGLAMVVLCGLAPTLWSAEPKTDTVAPAKAPAKKLTGAELYAINCNRCHAERYPTEFTSSQWTTIMLEMRVRANLPAKQSQKILKYLQEDAGGN